MQHSRDPKEDFPQELSPLEQEFVPSLSEHLLSVVVGQAGAKAEVPKWTKVPYCFVLPELAGSSQIREIPNSVVSWDP